MLLVRRHEYDTGGYQTVITHQKHGMKWLEFSLIILKGSERSVSESTFDHEVALIVLEGVVDVSVGGQKWSNLGGRPNVFAGLPTAIYVPRDSEYVVSAKTIAAEIAVCQAESGRRFEPFVVLPDQIRVKRRGQKHWRRDVRDILVAGFDERVDRLVIGETINWPGEWSGYPPHKHDEDSLNETTFEEIYHYRVNPKDGFGVQLHYQSKGDQEDTAYIVRDGDTFAIPDGYHPLAAAGGYRVYYLWCMAGPSGRSLKPFEDPRHRWVHGSE